MLGILKTIVFIFLVIVMIFSILLLVFDGKIPSLNKNPKILAKNKSSNKKKSKDNGKRSDKAKEEDNEVNTSSTQDFIDFEDIEIFSKDNPMGLIVRKNKTEYTGVIEVAGINYNLLSIEERETLEDSFGRLLNGIDYPLQIYIQSRKLDIDNYNNKYISRLDELKKTIDTLTSRYKFLVNSNEDNTNNEQIMDLESKIIRLTNQYNYGAEIKDYMMLRSTQKNILEKKYFIVITHKHNSRMFEEELTYEELLNNAFSDIANKASSIINALKRSKLDGKILNGVEIAELLYSAYNKSDSGSYKMANALKSNFSHLYTTSMPVELKKITRELEEVQKIKDEEINKLQELENKAFNEAASYYELDNEFDIDSIDFEMDDDKSSSDSIKFD